MTAKFEAQQTTIGPYGNLSFIRRGAVADVYVARKEDQEIAIKIPTKPVHAVGRRTFGLVLPQQIRAERERKNQQITREGETLARLDHSAIIPLLEMGMDSQSKRVYLVMPYMTGGSLAQHLRKSQPLSLSETEKIISQIGAALTYSHAKDIIHRDVKPGNILIHGITGDVLLADFGASSSVISLENLKDREFTIGTPFYRAPEQTERGAAVGPSSDQYGLAAIAYRLVTGNYPPQPYSPFLLVLSNLAQEERNQRLIVGPTIRRGLSPSPEDRFPTVKAFAEDFAEHVKHKRIFPGSPLPRRSKKKHSG